MSQNLADIPPLTGTSCKRKATTAIIIATTALTFLLQHVAHKTLRKNAV